MVITERINKFREAARHLWNTYLIDDADWDTVDAFREICAALFTEQVLRRKPNIPPIPVDAAGTPVWQYRMSASKGMGIPVWANRDIPASGYWDFPVTSIPREEGLEIAPIAFFDFDALAIRDLEFYRVRIVNSPSHPELNGRDALIKCEYLEIELPDSLNRKNLHRRET